MKDIHIANKFISHFIMAAILILSTSGKMADDFNNLEIITNIGSTPESLTLKQFNKVIRGEQQRWPGGKSISLGFIRTTQNIGKETCEKVFNMTTHEVNKFWAGLVFSGQLKTEPVFFYSESELIEFVSSTPGAIGIVSNTVKSDVVNKLVLVEK